MTVLFRFAADLVIEPGVKVDENFRRNSVATQPGARALVWLKTLRVLVRRVIQSEAVDEVEKTINVFGLRRALNGDTPV